MEESRSNQPWFVPAPYQKTIELADGTIVNGSAGLNDEAGDLWIWLDRGTSLTEAFRLFSDATKTVKITCHRSNIDTQTWSGFYQIALIREENGKVTIRMRR